MNQCTGTAVLSDEPVSSWRVETGECKGMNPHFSHFKFHADIIIIYDDHSIVNYCNVKHHIVTFLITAPLFKLVRHVHLDIGHGALHIALVVTAQSVNVV